MRPLPSIALKKHGIADGEQSIQGTGVRAQIVLALQDEGRLREEVFGSQEQGVRH